MRKTSAGQSLLVWKAYDKRLDGRTDAQRPNDVDFGAAHPTALTFLEKRLIAAWVDLGCLVDLDPGTVDVWDCFDDQMRPTLTTYGIDWNNAAAPLPTLKVGVFDMHSGIKANSLVVEATNLATNTSVLVVQPTVGSDGGVFDIDLSSLAAGVSYRIDLTVEDDFQGLSGHGNISRLSYTIDL